MGVLILGGLIVFVILCVSIFSSDWYKREQYFYSRSGCMDEFDDYLERMIENEILEDEFERDFCNSRRNVEEVPNREGKYNYEDLLFDEGAMFERVMEERGGNLEFRMKNYEWREKCAYCCRVWYNSSYVGGWCMTKDIDEQDNEKK